jgi:MFS family permease
MINESPHETTGPLDETTSPPAGGWLNRNVVGMSLTSLLGDAGHEMATAVLGGFLAVIGAPAYALGLLEGVADATSSFVKLGAGWWSDRLGHRKSIATAGYALTGISTGLFALAFSWPLVLVARVVGWFGRGVRGPLRDAMLADSVSQKDRGKAFGFHRAGDTLGAIIGPLIAAGLLVLLQVSDTQDEAWPFRVIFMISLVPGLGAALAFAWLVREKPRTPNHGLKFWASIGALPANFRRFLIGVGVFGAGDFAHTLLILAATQLLMPVYGVVQAAWIAALLYAGRNVLYTAASYPVGHLSDRYGRRTLLVAGYVLGALVMAGFVAAFVTATASILWLGALFALAGVYIAVEDALEGALTADLVPDETIRGTAFGVMGTVNGIGDFISSVVVGLLWSFSPIVGFSYAGIMMLAGAVLLHRVR